MNEKGTWDAESAEALEWADEMPDRKERKRLRLLMGEKAYEAMIWAIKQRKKERESTQ